MRLALATGALCAALVVGACGSNVAPADAPAGAATLAAIRSEVFTGTCASGSCHASPTLAAKLDLLDNGVCHLLVSQTSCLFPTKFLVLPGKPELSFLMDKLRGTALAGTPDPGCAATNERMPSGQPALPDSKISQIEAWIKAGADCGGDVGPDAGIDAGVALANVVSISAGSTTLQVGGMTQVTVTLNHGAPPGGQLLILNIFDSDDASVLGFPSSIQVAEGVSSVMFDVMGNKGGTGNAHGVIGWNLADGHDDGDVMNLTPSNDIHSMAQLVKLRPSHRLRVMGSQPRICSNSNLAYGIAVVMSVTLRNGKIITTSFPLDVVFRGQHHLAGLRGKVSLVATPRCPDLAAGGHNITKTGVTAWGYQATPASSNYTL